VLPAGPAGGRSRPGTAGAPTRAWSPGCRGGG
jgi:hypothetical protein